LGGGAGLPQVDGPGVHRDRRLAARLLERIARSYQRLLRQRDGGGLPAAPILDVGEQAQGAGTEVAGPRRPPDLVENDA